MESVVNPDFWRGRRVFLTGHTGFKGSWLAMWLLHMGADVTGFALPADEVSLFVQTGLAGRLKHVEGDIRDFAAVEAAMAEAQPEVVFHLAAQALVRLSYDEPVETFATNVQGTVHVLDACRRIPGLRAIVAVTSDKCYENNEWIWPYRESDPMGGYDPYSSSKGAAELVISAYRRSYFSGEGAPLLASVRAGNVIGGGDWALDRLIPDIIRALLAGKPPVIRSPASVRPWQHVLEALGGYLLIAQALFSQNRAAAEGWNFGPSADDTRPVNWIADRLTASWGKPGWQGTGEPQLHEAKLLSLDCSKARAVFGWRPTLNLGNALDLIVAWHKRTAMGEDAASVTLEQLNTYASEMCANLGGRAKGSSLDVS